MNISTSNRVYLSITLIAFSLIAQAGPLVGQGMMSRELDLSEYSKSCIQGDRSIVDIKEKPTDIEIVAFPTESAEGTQETILKIPLALSLFRIKQDSDVVRHPLVTIPTGNRSLVRLICRTEQLKKKRFAKLIHDNIDDYPTLHLRFPTKDKKELFKQTLYEVAQKTNGFIPVFRKTIGIDSAKNALSWYYYRIIGSGSVNTSIAMAPQRMSGSSDAASLDAALRNLVESASFPEDTKRYVTIKFSDDLVQDMESRDPDFLPKLLSSGVTVLPCRNEPIDTDHETGTLWVDCRPSLSAMHADSIDIRIKVPGFIIIERKHKWGSVEVIRPNDLTFRLRVTGPIPFYFNGVVQTKPIINVQYSSLLSKRSRIDPPKIHLLPDTNIDFCVMPLAFDIQDITENDEDTTGDSLKVELDCKRIEIHWPQQWEPPRENSSQCSTVVVSDDDGENRIVCGLSPEKNTLILQSRSQKWTFDPIIYSDCSSRTCEIDLLEKQRPIIEGLSAKNVMTLKLSAAQNPCQDDKLVEKELSDEDRVKERFPTLRSCRVDRSQPPRFGCVGVLSPNRESIQYAEFEEEDNLFNIKKYNIFKPNKMLNSSASSRLYPIRIYNDPSGRPRYSDNNYRVYDFSTKEECEEHDVIDGVFLSYYDSEELNQKRAHAGHHVKLVDGQGRSMSDCAQIYFNSDDRTLTFDLYPIGGCGLKRSLFIISLSRDISEFSREIITQVRDTVRGVSGSSTNFPFSIITIDSGPVSKEILGCEDFMRLRFDVDFNSKLDHLLRQNFRFGSRDLSALGDLRTIASNYPVAEIIDVLYITDGPEYGTKADSFLVPSMWTVKEVSLTVLTTAGCEPWNKHSKARCFDITTDRLRHEIFGFFRRERP